MAIEDVISALLPGADQLNLMAPQQPTPADLFGHAPQPYPAEFYEQSRYAPPAFTPLTPEEMQIRQQQQLQQNRQTVMAPMFGMGMV